MHLLRCLWIATLWSAVLLLVTAPVEELFGVGALLWFVLYMGVAAAYIVGRRTGRQHRLLNYTPNSFSIIWLFCLLMTFPLVKIIGLLVYKSLAPFKFFISNFFG